MGAQAKIMFKAIVKVAKSSGILDKQIKKIEDKVLDQGLKLIEEAGIDPTLLPIDIRSVLRGENPNFDANKLLDPRVICAMPQLSPQSKETTTRTINNARLEVEDIYRTTQAIKETTIALTKPIMDLQTSTAGLADSVEATSNVIQALKILPTPTAVAGVGVPAGLLNTFSSTLATLSDLVKAAAVDVRQIPTALGIMTGTVNSVIALLNGLNQILDPFLKLLTMVKSVVDLQDQCPLLNQSSIDNLKAELLSNIQGNLAQANLLAGITDDIEERLQLNSSNPYFYKSFQFILEDEPDNPYFLPSRRIRCFRANSTGFNDGQDGGGSVTIYNVNELTNPNLEPESYSYASSLLVLIAEAKFAVDTYTNNITLFMAPLFRDKAVKTSDGYINLADATYEELQQYAIQFGYDSVEAFVDDPDSPVNTYQSLPNYIVYGGTVVNLNNSPTDIEYGADALVQDSSYQGGTGISLSSYIQSGTIQVNQPVNLRLKTFGGTGNPIPNAQGVPIPRYTQALLTIKRSAAIQDNVNPFTGRIEGFGDGGAVNTFVEQYGQNSLRILENVNTTAQETGTGLDFGNPILVSASNYDKYYNDSADAIATNQSLISDFTALNDTLTFMEQLRYVYDQWYGLVEGEEEGNSSDNIRKAIDILFAKSQQLLYNEDVLILSKRLFGNKQENSNIRTDEFNELVEELGGQIALDINQDALDEIDSTAWKIIEGVLSLFSFGKNKENSLSEREKKLLATINENWYWTARRNAVTEGLTNVESRESSDRQGAKAATISMLYYGLRQFTAKFQELYGNRTEYNNGAWVSPATGLPLIPANVKAGNEDITIALESSQTAAVGQTINKIVGGLEVLGTYTYNLEIIDSNPPIGGIDFNFPTNVTILTVEDIEE